ncbi:MAG: hypothetical protein IPH22_11300 [Nitrosomonas sp.]|nr:hypothetical protein [Nitrosomonas sp.]
MHLMIKILSAITTITLLSINPVFSQTSAPSDYPVYKDGKLTIPRVDTDVQTGNYQKVEFQFDNATNSWKLINLVESKITPGPQPREKLKQSLRILHQYKYFLRSAVHFPTAADFSSKSIKHSKTTRSKSHCI